MTAVAPARRSANHWPGLDITPQGTRAAVSARIAESMFRQAMKRLPVTIRLDHASGTEVIGRGGPVMTVLRPEEFYARLGRDQLIGFGEAYLTHAWEAEDLGAFLTVLATRMQHLVPEPLQRLRSLVVRKPPAEEISTSANSQSNIAHHYDLSNELFEKFLDPTLSYSSALFSPGEMPQPTEADLEPAQLRKIDRLLDQAGVGDGTRLLEIGSGWGALAIRAAQRGATVRTITLSVEQKTLADERIRAAGLADSISVDICDYRDLVGPPSDTGEGGYDAVISVEMIEAVGWQYWTTYFETIDRVLAPGGRVAIQAITMPHDRMLVTRNTYTWINKYIFPGGFLPSVDVLDTLTREHTALRLVDRLSLGPSYAETLRLWDERFLAESEAVLALGFDDTFLRMWHFYLEYSRAGFASGYIDDYQLTWTKPASTEGA